MEKAENSLLIAKHLKEECPEGTRHHWQYWAITITYYAMLYAAKAAILQKGYEVKTHEAARNALTLLIPNEREKHDLELLGKTFLEDRHITYFEEAMTISQTARYQARPSYTERQLKDIFEKAREFIATISLTENHKNC